jgi:hypothetical protein
MHFAMEITGVLPAPFPLARSLARRLAFRLQTEPLVVGITRMRLVPNPTLTTFSESFRAHRLLPNANRREYDKRRQANCPFTHHVGRADRSRCHREEERK